MPVKLYVDLVSQPCRAVVIFVNINNIPYEEKTIQILNGDTRTEWFKKINPMGAVPVLQDGELILSESMAILKYLVENNEVTPNWYPSQGPQRSWMEEFIMWLYCVGGLRQKASMVFIEKVLKPVRSGKPVNEEQLKAATEALNDTLDLVEKVFMSRGDYIAGGNDISLADLVAVCELMQPISFGFNAGEGRPKLAAWLERVKKRLRPHFDDVHKTLFAFVASQNTPL